jgi:hypothetical protein
MMDDRVWHYIRPNETTRLPRRHIFLDTEARRVDITNGETQSWRVGVATFVSAEKGKATKEHTAVYDDPGKFWRDCEEFSSKRARTILWAHNLGYDVRIAEALIILPARGWRLHAHNLASRGTWFVWRKADATLTMVDSNSVFATPLQTVAKCFGLGKPELPGDDDSKEAWTARCAADVHILRTAIMAYLGWIESADLGNWQLTGSAQAYAAFRHRFLTHKMLVHDDNEALAAERRAMWTGRCEAFWHGALLGQVVHEWDFHLAYARIAQEYSIPVRLVGPMPPKYPWRRYLDHPKVAVLAEVSVTTALPVVPTERGGRMVWPTGTFVTTLWGPELKAALDAGATVTIVRGWLYRTEPALKAWAEWVIGQLAADDAEVPAWRKIILKQWARSLIGRFAMTYSKWEPFGTMPVTETRRWTSVDAKSKTQTDMVQIGRDVWHHSGTEEWSQSQPAITGFIMSVARVRLWNVISTLPREATLYVDTDSLFSTDRFHDQVKAVADSPLGHGLRLKRSWDGFAIYGPRQVVTGELVRISGLPTRARRVGRHEFEGNVWESLATSTKRGRFAEVRVMRRSWRIHGVDNRRKGGAIGWTEPIEV